MANISFTKSRTYKQFYTILHIAACIICITLTFLVIFAEDGRMYIPPIFIVAAFISFLNAYDKVNIVNKSKGAIRKCIHLAGVGAISIIMAIFTIVSFWT